MLPPPELRSRTDATVDLAPALDLDGSVLFGIVVKQRFYTGRSGLRRLLGAEITRKDVPWDEDAPETSSIRFPTDMLARKPGTDVIVLGSACAPHDTTVKTMDVFVRVGPIERMVRVHGPRTWYRGTFGIALSAPEPFGDVPLRWELAWGGSDTSDDGKLVEEPRNPVGRGVVADSKKLIHKPGPQIEAPDEPIGSPRGRHAPIGLGAIGRHWAPRRQYAGTYDEEWKRARMPLAPIDYDERFQHAAPPEQIAPGFLRGGEPVQLVGLHPDGPIVFELPRVAYYVGASIDGRLTEIPPRLDTVILMPTERALELVWRSHVRLPRPRSRLDFVQVHEKRAA